MPSDEADVPWVEMLLLQEPECEQSKNLQVALKECKDRELAIVRTLTQERTRLVLAEMHTSRLKTQLKVKEDKKKRKKGERH